MQSWVFLGIALWGAVVLADDVEPASRVSDAQARAELHWIVANSLVGNPARLRVRLSLENSSDASLLRGGSLGLDLGWGRELLDGDLKLEGELSDAYVSLSDAGLPDE